MERGCCHESPYKRVPSLSSALTWQSRQQFCSTTQGVDTYCDDEELFGVLFLIWVDHFEIKWQVVLSKNENVSRMEESQERETRYDASISGLWFLLNRDWQYCKKKKTSIGIEFLTTNSNPLRGTHVSPLVCHDIPSIPGYSARGHTSSLVSSIFASLEFLLLFPILYSVAGSGRKWDIIMASSP